MSKKAEGPAKSKAAPKPASSTAAPKAARSSTDWEAIERDYRAGAKSVREIAKAHSVSDTAIRKKATAQGWVRSGEVRTTANQAALIKVQTAALEDLNPKQLRFVSEYLIDLNATQSAIRAGYSPHTANEQGARLLAHASVRKAIDVGMADRLVRTEIDQDRIVRELLNVVLADANELVEFRRTCCRHCWGIGFGWQRTEVEMESDRRQHALDQAAAARDKDAKPIGPFDPAGGIGYDARRPPHPECPNCFSEGIGGTFVKDTRLLSPGARALYAGVKQTKDGLEIKMHDKQGFMQLLMRHAGMLNDKVKLQGDAENPLTTLLKQVSGTGLPIVKENHEDDE